ncbi:MAG: M48 family metalloprotease [Actinobacteria bacterium]|nr:M48 family metalloprotease [Actinomycetota bacterium]
MRTARFWGIGAAAAAWLVAAWFLWDTSVPNLALGTVEPESAFSRAHLERSGRYEGLLRANWALATLVHLFVLAAAAWFAPRLRLRGIRGGVALGAVTLSAVWLANVPFVLSAHWWRRRYDISDAPYSTILVDPWLERLGTLAAACGALAALMLLARRLGDRWWLLGGPAFALIGIVFLLAQPLLFTPRVEPLRDRELVAEIQALAREQGVGEVDVHVRDASRRTRALNAEFYGFGPTRRIVLWDTTLDGRLTRGEIRSLVAHELGHVQAAHVWKGVGWLFLLAVPGAYLVALACRRRGGLGRPSAVPVALLALAALELTTLPATSAVSRRYEEEADWLALRATRDPGSFEGLTKKLSRASLSQPDAPRWARIVLETHPTPLERIALARSRAAALPEGS